MRGNLKKQFEQAETKRKAEEEARKAEESSKAQDPTSKSILEGLGLREDGFGKRMEGIPSKTARKAPPNPEIDTPSFRGIKAEEEAEAGRAIDGQDKDVGRAMQANKERAMDVAHEKGEAQRAENVPNAAKFGLGGNPEWYDKDVDTAHNFYLAQKKAKGLALERETRPLVPQGTGTSQAYKDVPTPEAVKQAAMDAAHERGNRQRAESFAEQTQKDNDWRDKDVGAYMLGNDTRAKSAAKKAEIAEQGKAIDEQDKATGRAMASNAVPKVFNDEADRATQQAKQAAMDAAHEKMEAQRASSAQDESYDDELYAK